MNEKAAVMKRGWSVVVGIAATIVLVLILTTWVRLVIAGPVPTGWRCADVTACEPLPFVAGPVPTGWTVYDGAPRADGFRHIELWHRDDGAWVVRKVQ